MVQDQAHERKGRPKEDIRAHIIRTSHNIILKMFAMLPHRLYYIALTVSYAHIFAMQCTVRIQT